MKINFCHWYSFGGDRRLSNKMCTLSEARHLKDHALSNINRGFCALASPVAHLQNVTTQCKNKVALGTHYF